jgi:hypothetical protein
MAPRGDLCWCWESLVGAFGYSFDKLAWSASWACLALLVLSPFAGYFHFLVPCCKEFSKDCSPSNASVLRRPPPLAELWLVPCVVPLS